MPEHETEARLDENDVDAQIQDRNSDVDDFNDPELALEDHEYEGWDDADLEESDGGGGGLEGMEEEDFTGM